jgi:hypothetical protein
MHHMIAARKAPHQRILRLRHSPLLLSQVHCNQDEIWKGHARIEVCYWMIEFVEEIATGSTVLSRFTFSVTGGKGGQQTFNLSVMR